MHAAYLGNVLRIIREQTRQKDARRKPISARTAGFQPGTTETFVSEFVRTFRFAAPKLWKEVHSFKGGYLRIWSLRDQETRVESRVGHGLRYVQSPCNLQVF